MRYRKPFTAEQRRNATFVYRSLRVTLSVLQARFSPRDAAQREVARELRAAIRDFGRTLQLEDDRVPVTQLNELREKADRLALRYASLRLG